MKINLTSVLVDDRDRALKFYADVLGIVKKTEIEAGEATVAVFDDTCGDLIQLYQV